MSNDTTDTRLAIMSAIAGEAAGALREDVSLAIEIIEDRIQFLVDAELIDVDADCWDEMVREIIHVALDAVLDCLEEEDDEEQEECDSCEDCDEDECERAY